MNTYDRLKAIQPGMIIKIIAVPNASDWSKRYWGGRDWEYSIGIWTEKFAAEDVVPGTGSGSPSLVWLGEILINRGESINCYVLSAVSDAGDGEALIGGMRGWLNWTAIDDDIKWDIVA